MNHSETARAIARETGWDLDGYAEERDWAGVGVGPVGRHRDSGSLDKSNFDVILADLRTSFGEDAIDVAHFGHWGVGWVDELVWDFGHEGIATAVQEWRTALDDYPVADDMAFSEQEWADNHPSDSECYSDDPECCPELRDDDDDKGYLDRFTGRTTEVSEILT